MRLHHFGVFTKDINISSKEYEKIGFSVLEDTVLDEHRNIYILFMQNNDMVIELIQKADISTPSPVDMYLDKKEFQSIYHTCYSVNNISAAIEELTHSGYVLISKPECAVAIQNKKVCFLYNKHVGIIELVED